MDVDVYRARIIRKIRIEPKNLSLYIHIYVWKIDLKYGTPYANSYSVQFSVISIR